MTRMTTAYRSKWRKSSPFFFTTITRGVKTDSGLQLLIFNLDSDDDLTVTLEYHFTTENCEKRKLLLRVDVYKSTSSRLRLLKQSPLHVLVLRLQILIPDRF